MKLEELKLNGYYTLPRDKNKDITSNYLFKNTEVVTNQPYINNGVYSKNGHIKGSHNKDKEFRFATASEIAHLDACIAANKYVEPSEINKEMNYEIY